MKEKLKQSIREKEMQMAKLAPLIDKNPVCSNLFNKVLIEKAVLRKQLEELNSDTFFGRVKRFLPKNQKLICDYFN
ncbi:MAG: hypothetical protein NC390_02115 [Fusobacterium sp.]|nr:hypothetical protein [Fusobacterium sp.]